MSFGLAHLRSRWLGLPHLVLVRVKALRRNAALIAQLLSSAQTVSSGTIMVHVTGPESQGLAHIPTHSLSLPLPEGTVEKRVVVWAKDSVVVWGM